jgi:hypothetical protein
VLNTASESGFTVACVTFCLFILLYTHPTLTHISTHSYTSTNYIRVLARSFTHLSNITATFKPNNAYTSTAWRLLGFRHVALVTFNDTDPTERSKAANSPNGKLCLPHAWLLIGRTLHVLCCCGCVSIRLRS